MKNYKNLIFEASYVNGEWIKDSDEKVAVKNPADGSTVGYVYNNDATTINKAIDAAYDAFPNWRKKLQKHVLAFF